MGWEEGGSDGGECVHRAVTVLAEMAYRLSVRQLKEARRATPPRA